jgi:hypothetical protein
LTLLSIKRFKVRKISTNYWRLHSSSRIKVCSITHPTRCKVNLIFIALSHRHLSTYFRECCANHQEPPSIAFAATGYCMIARLDVLQAVVGLLVRLQCVLAPPTRGCKGNRRGLLMMGTTVPETCLRDKAINIRLIVHLVGCFIEYLKMHGTTNSKVCSSIQRQLG